VSIPQWLLLGRVGPLGVVALPGGQEPPASAAPSLAVVLKALLLLLLLLLLPLVVLVPGVLLVRHCVRAPIEGTASSAARMMVPPPPVPADPTAGIPAAAALPSHPP
jgi:hypothetical protein